MHAVQLNIVFEGDQDMVGKARIELLLRKVICCVPDAMLRVLCMLCRSIFDFKVSGISLKRPGLSQCCETPLVVFLMPH